MGSKELTGTSSARKDQLRSTENRIYLTPDPAHDPFTRLILHVEDVPSSNISEHFEASKDFISAALNHGGVLVHCFEGRSRSATIVTAFLVAADSSPANVATALSAVRGKRSLVKPNQGFIDQLRDWESSK